jgi:predicted N-acyltransferase
MSSKPIPEYSIYNHPAFAEFISNYFGWEHISLRILDDQKHIATLPFVKTCNKWICLPFASAMGFCLITEYVSKIELIEFLSTVMNNQLKLESKKDWQIEEVRAGFSKNAIGNTTKPTWEIRSFIRLSEHVYAHKSLSVLALEGNIEAQEKIFSSNLRRKIRKAEKNGISIRMGRQELTDDFYSVYSRNCHRLGTPVLKKDFYAGMLKAYPQNQARFFIAYYREKPIGAALLLGYQDVFENIFFATHQKYNHLYPSYLLNQAMIAYAIKYKANTYSFGRSSIGSGTHQYKQQWGVTDIPIYWNLSQSHKNIREFAFLRKLWQALPYRLSLIIGPAIAGRLY